ncbi:MAG: DUF3877 family protein [Lachnospiraceae bacterium]|nr:DUF3877 family protein [Lachnospiraceae bacterium]
MKIGYREGDMKLYYPAESLAGMLGLQKGFDEAALDKALTGFCEAVRDRLGAITLSRHEGRYCVDIPDAGCAYVAEQVPEPAFLKCFLEIVTSPGKTIEDVRDCFAKYAAEHGSAYEEQSSQEHEMGYVFSFTDEEIDPYVYCVEDNEFGLTYHRFSKTDYAELL